MNEIVFQELFHSVTQQRMRIMKSKDALQRIAFERRKVFFFFFHKAGLNCNLQNDVYRVVSLKGFEKARITLNMIYEELIITICHKFFHLCKGSTSYNLK